MVYVIPSPSRSYVLMETYGTQSEAHSFFTYIEYSSFLDSKFDGSSVVFDESE